MKIKTITCWTLLAALTWLTTYQICDASEDAAEDIAASALIASHHGFSISSPQAPDDDADAQIPIIISQALTLHPFIGDTSGRVLRLPSGLCQTPHVAAAVSASTNRSPPGRFEVLPSGLFHHPQQAFVPSLSSLAPPQA